MTSELLNTTQIHCIFSFFGCTALFIIFHFFSAIYYFEICLGNGVIFQTKNKAKINYFISDFGLSGAVYL